MPEFDWVRKIDYGVSAQAYANGVIYNFTMYALEVGPGGKLYFSTHSTISEVLVNNTNLTVSTVSGQGWGLNINYPQGLAYNGSQMYTTDYSGNNASLHYWSATAAYGSVATLGTGSGYGYGGVPLVSTWNGLGNGAVYRASPVTGDYNFSGFSGLNLCTGSTPAGLPTSLTFTGGAGGGFFDVTFDGQYWYTLAPASVIHSNAATYTSNSGQVRVDVYNANGTFREARYIYTIPAGSNQQPGGIAYDPIRKCLWVSIVNGGNSTAPLSRLLMIPVRKTGGRRGWGVTMIGETGRGVY